MSERAEIISAIAKAMGEMKRISKDNKNTEQRYDFASVDDFLAMTGPVCAKNGLVTIMDEDSVENFDKAGKYGNTLWARYTFQITTYHSSGQSIPTVRRSVEVIRSGAQAAGSAQSYVLKQYQRALYQIPTGDKDDPDHGSVAEVERAEERRTGVQNARQEAANATAPKEAVDAAISSLNNAEGLDKLAAIWGGLPDAVKRTDAVFKAKEDRKAAIQKSSLDGDEIPY